MKKYTFLFLSLLVVVTMSAVFTSCSDDDEPSHLTVSFARSTQTVSEGVGVVEVSVVLDQEASEDITVDYDLGGTATEGSTATSDYEVTDDAGEVQIKKGQSSAIIELKIKSDGAYEGDETIELSIENVSSGNIDISEDNTIVITITEDDAQPIVSFGTNTFTTTEDVFEFQVPVTLDRAASQDITITYSIEDQGETGTALDSIYVYEEGYSSLYYDYYVDGESGKVVIPKGETTANIELRIYTDFWAENTETIKLKLTGGDGGVAVTGTAAKQTTTITVKQQDGEVVVLEWGTDDANMDMYIWVANTLEDLEDPDAREIVAYSNFTLDPGDGDEYAYEQLIIPSILIQGEDGDDDPYYPFGISYVYYSGSLATLPFEVSFLELVDGDVVDGIGFEATYTQANINTFPDADGEWPLIAQTFEAEGGVFTNISDITVPTSGSRVRSSSGAMSGNALSAFAKKKVLLANPRINRLKQFNLLAPQAGIGRKRFKQ